MAFDVKSVMLDRSKSRRGITPQTAQSAKGYNVRLSKPVVAERPSVEKFLCVYTTLKGVSIVDFCNVNEAQQHRSKNIRGFSI